MKHLLLTLLCLMALAACGGTTPAEEPDLVATQVAVERAAAATLTAEAVAAAPTSTEAAVTPTQLVATVPPVIVIPTPRSTTPEVATPEPATSTPTPTTVPVQPSPTPTQITAVVFPVDGSNGNQALRGSFIQSNGGRNVLLIGIEQAQVTTPMIFRDRLPVRVEVFDDTVGQQDGDGIAAVDFSVSGPSGGEVLRVVEETAPYCMWGGNDPNCPAPSFADLGYTWPQTGAPIENGVHSAAIVITGTNDTSITWFWTFEIDHGEVDQGDQQAAAPVEVVLRPACGNRVTVPAGSPIDLIYGIWASRGQERAAANAPYTAITLVIDGQNINGQVVESPVADLPQAICNRDYEDSYWVYSRAQLPPLTPGVYYVQVRYSFSRSVDDGYGSTYTQPFTQQYQIVVE